MAEMAVSFVVDQLHQLLLEEAILLRGIHNEFSYIKVELERIQAFLKDADKRAAVEEDNIPDGVRTWVKRVMEAAFRIEDFIDEIMILVAPQPRDSRCATLLHKIAHLVKPLIPLHKIAYEIQDIKSSVCEIKEGIERYGFQCSFGRGSNSFKRSQNAKQRHPKLKTVPTGIRYLEEKNIGSSSMCLL